jgi:hypothetical protein
MAVWFVRRLQWLVCEEFTLFPVEIATGARTAETSAMIVEAACCARDNVRMH